MSERIQPRLLKGFRDLMPEWARARRELIETCRRLYERYGFLPLETPTLEHRDVLTGDAYGSEGAASIFNFVGPEETPIAMRFDLTVPLARVVSQYPEIAKPFRRWQVANVFRVDKPGPGRFREFTQMDIDIVGTDKMAADAEILCIMYELFEKELKVPARIRFSNRKILSGLCEVAGVEKEREADILRVLDKFDRIGVEGVAQELGVGRVDVSGDKIKGMLLSDEQIKKITDFLNIPANTRTETLELLKEHSLNTTDSGIAGIAQLSEICELLNALGIPDDKVVIDPSVARGLAYYTGTVFECWLTDLPAFGAVFSGGRYDGLVNRFSELTLPAVGASIGIDRLLAALIEIGDAGLLERLEYRKATADVLILPVFGVTHSQAFALAQKYREAGIKTEVYVGKEKQPKKMFSYADATGVRFAVIVGPDEIAKNEVSVKDLVEGKKASEELYALDHPTEQKVKVTPFALPAMGVPKTTKTANESIEELLDLSHKYKQYEEKLAEAREERRKWLQQRAGQKSMTFDESIQYILDELKTTTA